MLTALHGILVLIRYIWWIDDVSLRLQWRQKLASQPSVFPEGSMERINAAAEHGSVLNETCRMEHFKLFLAHSIKPWRVDLHDLRFLPRAHLSVINHLMINYHFVFFNITAGQKGRNRLRVPHDWWQSVRPLCWFTSGWDTLWLQQR